MEIDFASIHNTEIKQIPFKEASWFFVLEVTPGQ